jgi:hypothetical protein
MVMHHLCPHEVSYLRLCTLYYAVFRASDPGNLAMGVGRTEVWTGKGWSQLIIQALWFNEPPNPMALTNCANAQVISRCTCQRPGCPYLDMMRFATKPKSRSDWRSLNG